MSKIKFNYMYQRTRLLKRRAEFELNNWLRYFRFRNIEPYAFNSEDLQYITQIYENT